MARMKRLFLAPLLVTACGGAASAAPPRAAHTTSASPEDARVTRGLLEDLVRVDTSHGNETAALEPVARRLRAAGVSFEIVESSPGRGNLVARVRGTGKKKPLLVMAHVDVVPVEGQKWSTPPFTPTEKDGFLYGRGINDDKSMAASAVLVLLELAKAPKRPSRDVIVALTAGEETGGAAGIKHLLTQRRDLIDAEIALEPFPLHLGPWSLEESIRRMTDVAKVQGLAVGASIPAGELVSEARPIVEPILSLLLYLCAENAEIGDGQARPANPTPKRTKSGPRLFAPDRSTTWDVGVRLGAALRRAYHASETAGDGTHAGPRPHVRRAHWHGFRSGAMKREDGSPIAAGDREFKLRWLPPIPVNLDDVSDLPATIRPVKGR